MTQSFEFQAPSLHNSLRDLIRRAPVSMEGEASVRAALEQMQREQISAIVIAQAQDMKPRGLVSLRDVLTHIVLPGAELSLRLDSVMHTPYVALQAEASAHDAMLAMTRAAARYVLVIERDGRLIGVISRSDLQGAHRFANEELVRAIVSARHVSELATAAADVRLFLRRLVAQGMNTEQLAQWRVPLNDLIRQQAIDLMRARFDLPDVAWCWLDFGVGGRFEQTLSCVQENGLLFALAEGADPEPVRQAFLPFAQSVNQALDDCGFALCQSQIMSGNARYCLSEQEWRQRFASSLTDSSPDALLKASSFFDLRPLFGDYQMADELRSWLLDYVSSHRISLRLMAHQAMQSAVPLGVLRTFVVDRKALMPNSIDLEVRGIRPFVDAARVLALACNVRASNTVQRLREVGRMASLAISGEAAVEGFQFIQTLHLRRQLAALNGEDADRIAPRALNGMERHLLRQAFREAQSLQKLLKAEFRL